MLFRSKIGGLLRFLRRQPVGYCLVGGVSRAEDDSVSERVLSRLYDDSSTGGQASPQGEEPCDDSSQSRYVGSCTFLATSIGLTSIGSISLIPLYPFSGTPSILNGLS